MTTLCKLCGATMKANWVRHLKCRHPNVYEVYMRKRNYKPNKFSDAHFSGSVIARYGRRCWAREYSTEVSARKYSCNICDRVMSVISGFGNMVRHIRIKHPTVYAKRMAFEKKIADHKQWLDLNNDDDGNKDAQQEERLETHSTDDKNEEAYEKETVEIESIEENDEGTRVLTYQPLKRSYIWNFFLEVAPPHKGALCKACGIILQDNKLRHLKTRHPDLHKEFQMNKVQRNVGGVDSSREVLRKQKSYRCWARNYANKVNMHRYRCNICETVISVTSGFSNMVRHIRIRHPAIYAEEMNSRYKKRDVKEIGSSEKLDAEDISEEYILEADTYEDECEDHEEERLESDSDVTNCSGMENE